MIMNGIVTGNVEKNTSKNEPNAPRQSPLSNRAFKPRSGSLASRSRLLEVGRRKTSATGSGNAAMGVVRATVAVVRTACSA
jgi:hypothetical protein